MNLGWFCNC